MKKQIFYWLMSQRHNIDRRLKKKLLIGLGVVGALVIVGGVILTYVGYKTTTYLISKAPTQDQISVMASDLKNQSQKVLDVSIQKNCLSELQAHLNLGVWLSRPISENTAKISSACFGQAEVKETNNIEGAKNDENYI